MSPIYISFIMRNSVYRPFFFVIDSILRYFVYTFAILIKGRIHPWSAIALLRRFILVSRGPLNNLYISIDRIVISAVAIILLLIGRNTAIY